MHLTEHSLVNRSQNHPSHPMRLRRSITFVASALLSVLASAACSGADSPPAPAKGKGRVTIVYQDDAIQPENRNAIKKIRDSGVFERLADRLTTAVALPHDLQVVVTDKTPKGRYRRSGYRGRWWQDLVAGGLLEGAPRRPHRVPS